MLTSADILHGKILIVDDRPVDVQLLEQTLRGAGYLAISSTMDPGQVRALHVENRYDLILLDLQMPGMDGFEVMEGLKELEKDGYLAGAGRHRPPGSQGSRAAGRRQGLRQQAVRPGRGVAAGPQPAGGPPPARRGPPSRQGAGVPGAERPADGAGEPAAPRRPDVDGHRPCAPEQERHGGDLPGSGRLQADQRHAGARRRGRRAAGGRRAPGGAGARRGHGGAARGRRVHDLAVARQRCRPRGHGWRRG